MRMTVIVTDALYFLAVFLFVRWGRRCLWSQQVFHVMVLLSQPALMLIDHGHFQYNSFSLALVVLCIICLMRGASSFAMHTQGSLPPPLSIVDYPAHTLLLVVVVLFRTRLSRRDCLLSVLELQADDAVLFARRLFLHARQVSTGAFVT